MRSFLFTLCTLALFSLVSCTTCEGEQRYKAATQYGGWKARFDQTEARVQAIEKQATPSLFLNKEELAELSTEYPYWTKGSLYTREQKLIKAMLEGGPDKVERHEWFYFEDEQLIQARFFDRQTADTLRYFYEAGVLVFALNQKNKTLDIEDRNIRLRATDLKKEAAALQALHKTLQKRNT